MTYMHKMILSVIDTVVYTSRHGRIGEDSVIFVINHIAIESREKMLLTLLYCIC